MSPKKKKYFVTTALPYANGSLHMGHLIENIDADIWVRYQRGLGHDVYFVSGDDAHGTPIMIRAEKEQMSARELVDRVYHEHKSILQSYNISLDFFGRTDTEKNQQWCYKIYERLSQTNIFEEKEIEQYFDEHKGLFLPDRFIKGTCPFCHAPDQNGDSCESCGKTYQPTDLLDPYSIISGKKPVLRKTTHLFVRLESYRAWLKEYLPGKIPDAVFAKLQEWLYEPLRSWDITRDSPYHGIEMPHRKGQYFYVWFDAPIGYLSIFDLLFTQSSLEFESVLRDPESALIHFIGKDIAYFHCVFWPIVLYAAGLKTPEKIFVHGFLTIKKQKMSKSRGLSIDPKDLLRAIHVDAIRYYLASKMNGTIDDIDFDVDECVDKINSDLVGKSLNILSRCSKLLQNFFDGKFCLVESSQIHLPEDFLQKTDQAYQERQYHIVCQHVMKYMDLLNQDLTEIAPWTLLKNNPHDLLAWQALSKTLLMFKQLILVMRPILPSLSDKILGFYNEQALSPYEILLQRLDKMHIQEQVMSSETQNQTPIQQAQVVIEEPKSAPALKPVISIETFAQVDLRIAKVLECSAVEKSEKLLRFQLDIGQTEPIQVFSGIKAYVNPEEMIGRYVVVCVNLAPRKMSVGLSQGMILSAHNHETLKPLLGPDLTPGALIS